MCTHEKYIHSVATIAIRRVTKKREIKRLKDIKLVYGVGNRSLRGVTYYDAWKNGKKTANSLVEVCAFGESNNIQLAGTTIHELGHVLAGPGAGHGKGWKAACKVLGLHISQAGGQQYQRSDFADDIWKGIEKIKVPTDGAPSTLVALRPGGPRIKVTPKPCGMGIGTRGGKSRGAGSGSRLVRVECKECGYICRVTRKWLEVGPPRCPDHGAMVESV